MRKTLLVLRHEILTALRSKSYLFGAFALPLIGVLVFVVITMLRPDEGNASVAATPGGSPDELRTEGYVDQSGIIEAIPPEIPAGILRPYPDEAQAAAALQAGEIAAYYVIPAGYIESGTLVYINPDYSLLSEENQSWVMRNTIFANLLGNDPERVARAWRPMDVQVRALAPQDEPDEDNPLTFFVPYGTMMIFYVVILMGSSLLLNSVNNEKKNRIMEILLASITPQQMLSGKILGLGILGLLQAALWVGTGYTLLRISGRTFSLPPGFELPPSILVWGAVFFLLGYAVYASLMAGLGALVPNLKEASQATFVVIWPLLIPLFFFVALVEHPEKALATGLSLFPLTAPVAMMTRLATGRVPWWQPAVAAVLLAATAFLIVRAVAGMFRAQTLLSGQPFSTRRFLAALLGRA
jgi:ABC-2 type transport system permease protein